MKKLIATMLCAVMMISLVACSGSPSEEEVRGEQTSNEESQDESEVESTEEFSMGETENLVYENKFIGIGCKLESDWYFYNDEEIMELNNYTSDAAGEDFEEIMKEADLIYDMYAICDDQLDNINVNLEKMSKAVLDSLVIEDSLEATIPILEEAFTNMGYTNLQAGIDTIRIEGEELTCLYSAGEVNGLKMYQKIFPIKCDGYLANITITTYEEDTVDSIAESFYFVK